MKLQSLLCATALIGVSLFTSCNKTDDVLNNNGSGNLTAGKGRITFNTNVNFAGSTSYDGSGAVNNVATRTQGAGTFDQITILNTTISGTTARTAEMIIELDRSLTTTSGNLNSDFSNQSSASIIPIFTISGTTNNDAYASQSGAVVITKLTATEIEGTFSGHLVNDNNHTSIEVSNGTFAGKFQ